MRQTHEDATGVIEKISVSMSPKPTDKERGVKVHSIEAQRIEDLNTKLDILLKKERSVHFAKTDDEIDDDEVAVNFYTKAKTQSLRSKISGFQQATSESFGDAWDR